MEFMRWLAMFAVGCISALAEVSCALATPLPTPTSSSPSLTPVVTPERLVPTPTQLALSPTPAAVEDNPPGPDGQPTLVVVRPQAGQRVRSPLAVEGTAITFEGVVNVALLDGQGRTLQEGVTVATRGAPERGSFALSLTFTPPNAEIPGTLEVFIRSARDGSVLHRVRVPVLLTP